MISNKHFVIALFSVISINFVSVSHANNGFPPENLFSSDKFPPSNPALNNAWSKSQINQRQVPNFSSMRPRMPVAPRIPQTHFSRNGYNNSYNNYPNRHAQRPASRYTPYPSRPSQQNNAYRNNYRNPSQNYSRNNMMPFGNFGNFGNGNSFPFAGGNMPFMNNRNNSFGGFPNNPMNNMFGGNNSNMPFFGNTGNKNRKKAWGDERHIWPDFYTDFTDEAWDTMSSGPRDLGVMPGGWRFPHISTPDPVTVSDAITNQFPPIGEEMGNMMDISDWGVFDNK